MLYGEKRHMETTSSTAVLKAIVQEWGFKLNEYD